MTPRSRAGASAHCPWPLGLVKVWRPRMHDLRHATRRLDVAAALVTTLLVTRAYGPVAATRYIAGYAGAAALQQVGLSVLYRHAPPEPASAPDLVTYGRASCGAVLASLIASGVRDRDGLAGWLAFLTTLAGATALDWLDGPLARQTGPTPLGSALDIEADSWLTLWSALAATAWGTLPRWSLVPPLLRYVHLLLDWRDGTLPAGGGPWWSRVTGVGQMALIVAALAPQPQRGRWPIPPALVALVSGAQTVSLLRVLARRVRTR